MAALNRTPRTTDTSTPPIRVALVDDHEVVRLGLAQMVAAVPGYTVAFTAGHGEEYLAKSAVEPPVQLVLVDLRMPVMDGYVTMALIRTRDPKVRLLALTDEHDGLAVQRALRAGALGVVHKGMSPAELQEALCQVTTGGYHRNALLELVLDGRGRLPGPGPDAERDRWARLSDEERRFVKQVCAKDHPRYRVVAERMGVKPATVRTYRDRVFAKLGIHCRQELLVLALRHGLVVH